MVRTDSLKGSVYGWLGGEVEEREASQGPVFSLGDRACGAVGSTARRTAS